MEDVPSLGNTVFEFSCRCILDLAVQPSSEADSKTSIHLPHITHVQILIAHRRHFTRSALVHMVRSGPICHSRG